jgi:hypothetical protein
MDVTVNAADCRVCSWLTRLLKQDMSRTSMFTAQRSSLGGNKLVPSRTFCPRAVARGLAEEERWKGEGVDVTSFLEFSFCGQRTLWLQLSRRGLGIWGGGRPAGRGLRVLLHSKGLSGRRDRRLVALFVGVRACGLPPSALFLLGNFDPAGSTKWKGVGLKRSLSNRGNYPEITEENHEKTSAEGLDLLPRFSS